MCMPRWDSEAVFASLGGGPGAYIVAPDKVDVVWGGYYEPGSLIWRSRWVTTDAVDECRDALAYPGDERRAVVLRRIECLRGTGADARRTRSECWFRDPAHDGDFQVRPAWTARTGSLRLRWTGGEDAARRDGRLVTHVDLAAGDRHDLVLELCEDELPSSPIDPARTWEETGNAWRRAVPSFENSISVRDSRRAYAVLRGLTVLGWRQVAAHGPCVGRRCGLLRQHAVAG